MVVLGSLGRWPEPTDQSSLKLKVSPPLLVNVIGCIEVTRRDDSFIPASWSVDKLGVSGLKVQMAYVVKVNR